MKTRQAESAKKENLNKMDSLNFYPQEQRLPFRPKRSSRNKRQAMSEESDASNNSSFDSEIFNNAYSACISTDQSPERSSSDISQSKLESAFNIERNFFAENSQNNSFHSHGKSEMSPQSVFGMSPDTNQSISPFNPNAGVQNYSQQISPYQYMVDTNVPVFQPTQPSMGNCNFSMMSGQSQQPLAPYQSSGQNYEFTYKPSPAFIQEKPVQMVELSQEDYKMIGEVEYLAFDQSGCRMIQKRLEDMKDVAKLASFTSQVVDSML